MIPFLPLGNRQLIINSFFGILFRIPRSCPQSQRSGIQHVEPWRSMRSYHRRLDENLESLSLSREKKRGFCLGCLSHLQWASSPRSSASPHPWRKPLATTFFLHAAAPLGEVSGSGGTHDFSDSIHRISVVPGNWALELKDSQVTWAILFHGGYLAWTPWGDHPARGIRENKENTESDREKVRVVPTFLAAFWLPVLKTASYYTCLALGSWETHSNSSNRFPTPIYIYMHFFLSLLLSVTCNQRKPKIFWFPSI